MTDGVCHLRLIAGTSVLWEENKISKYTWGESSSNQTKSVFPNPEQFKKIKSLHHHVRPSLHLPSLWQSSGCSQKIHRKEQGPFNRQNLVQSVLKRGCCYLQVLLLEKPHFSLLYLHVCTANKPLPCRTLSPRCHLSGGH